METNANANAGPEPEAGNRPLGTLALFVVVSLAFGTGLVGVKAGLADLPPLLFAAIRYDLGAIVLLAVVFWRGGYWRPRTQADWTAVAVAGVFITGLNAALFFLGQQHITAGTAAVTFGLVPVLAPAFAFALLGIRLDSVGLVGVLVGLVGLAIVVGPGAVSSGDETAALGVTLVGAAAVSVAFGSVLLQRVERDIPVLSMAAWALSLAAVLVHAASLATGESQTATDLSLATVFAVFWVGVPATAVAFPAYYALIDRAGPVRANLVSYTVPPVATVASAVVLGEVVPPRVVVGFVLILVGFVLVERRNLRPRRASSPSIDRSGSEPTGSMRTTRKRGERSR